MVVIYQFESYDVHSDQIKTSRRWGLKEKIESIPGLRVLEETRTEVERSAIQSDIEGLTAIGYIPPAPNTPD
jgi:hypothetical protein